MRSSEHQQYGGSFCFSGDTDYVAFMELDLDGRVTKWSRGSERLLGYTAGEVLGSKAEIFYRDKDASLGLQKKLLAHAAEQGEMWSEGWRKKKDGSVFLAGVLCQALYGKDSAQVGYIKTYEQVVQTQSEVTTLIQEPTDWFMVKSRALRRSSPFHEGIISMSEGFFVVDEDGQFMFGNGGGHQLKPSHALGSNDSIAQAYGLCINEKGTPFPEQELCIVRALAGEPVIGQDVCALHSQQACWLHMCAIPLVDESKHHYGALVSFKQLDREKRDEELLEVFWKALDQSINSVAIASYNEKDMPLIYVNKSFERTTGFSAAEVIGKNCRFLQGDDRDQEARQIIRAALAQGSECSVVIRNYRKDGSLFWNQLSLSPIINRFGQITHYLAFQNDITALLPYIKKLNIE